MAVYVVIAQPNPNNSMLGESVASGFPGDHLRLGPEAWLVDSKDTAKAVGDKIGVNDGARGSAVIVDVGGAYWGRASNEVWNWLKDRLERPGG